jgi:hypothetical protein
MTITTCQTKEIKREDLLSRIQSYLGNGGLFNPECMEHNKVRDLIMDCNEFLLNCSVE